MATKTKTGIVALATAGVAAGTLGMTAPQASAHERDFNRHHRTEIRHFEPRHFDRGSFRIGIAVGLPRYTPPPVVYVAPPAPVYVPPVQQYAPQYPVYAPTVPQYAPQYPVYAPPVQQYVPQYPVYAPTYVPERAYYVPQHYVGVRIGPRGVGLRIGGETPIGWVNFGLRLRR